MGRVRRKNPADGRTDLADTWCCSMLLSLRVVRLALVRLAELCPVQSVPPAQWVKTFRVMGGCIAAKIGFSDLPDHAYSISPLSDLLTSRGLES